MVIFCMLLKLSLKAPHIKSAATTCTLNLHIYTRTYAYDEHKIICQSQRSMLASVFRRVHTSSLPVYRNFSHKVYQLQACHCCNKFLSFIGGCAVVGLAVWLLHYTYIYYEVIYICTCTLMMWHCASEFCTVFFRNVVYILHIASAFRLNSKLKCAVALFNDVRINRTNRCLMSIWHRMRLNFSI